MAIWILIDSVNTIIPYIITIMGSIFLIGIYLVAITKGVPIVGVEREADVLATVSKMLQASIIGITAILICSLESKQPFKKRTNIVKNAFFVVNYLLMGMFQSRFECPTILTSCLIVIPI